MNFNYNIKPTKTRKFAPTTLSITIGNKVITNDVEVVRIDTELKQETSNGYIIEVARNEFPVSVLAAIDGFDIETMSQTINTDTLSKILATFDLELVK